MRFPLQHFVQQRDGDARASAADRMAQGNGPAIHIELAWIQVKLTIAGQNLGSKGLVQFNQIKVTGLEAMLLLEFPQGRHRTDTHGSRIDSSRRYPHDSDQRH